jgi:hypothetical protein
MGAKIVKGVKWASILLALAAITEPPPAPP